jgi:cell division protein FtsB
MDVSDEGGYVLYAEFEVTRKKLVAAEEEIKRLREAAGKIEKCAIYAKGEYIAKIAREALGKKTKKEK